MFIPTFPYVLTIQKALFLDYLLQPNRNPRFEPFGCKYLFKVISPKEGARSFLFSFPYTSQRLVRRWFEILHASTAFPIHLGPQNVGAFKCHCFPRLLIAPILQRGQIGDEG
jgi:hypothetical protein